MIRIKTIASLVFKDAKIIDIGTDHAYLPIYLYEHNITHDITASDISKNVLEYSKSNLKKHNLDTKIKLLLSDGFKNITDTYDIAVISGMGTHTIIDILSNGVLPDTLIISSHNDLPTLRTFMQSINYKIDKELVIYENNKYYSIIKYVKGYEAIDPYITLVGKSNNLEYINYLLDKYKDLYQKSNNPKYLEYINIIERKRD